MTPEQSLHNAAVLMRHLGEEEASAVFATLSPELGGRLKAVIAKNEAEAPKKKDDIPVKYTPVASSHSQLVSDAGRYVRQILGQAFPGDIATSDTSPGGQVPHPQMSGFERLRQLDPSTIARVCGAEHPQVIAAILVQIERSLGSAALGHLVPQLQADVMLRIATLQGIGPAAVRELDGILSDALDRREMANAGPRGGARAAAELLGRLDSAAQGPLLEAIRRQDPALAQKIQHNLNPPGARP